MFCDLVIQVWKYLLEVQCPSVPVKEVQGGLNYMYTSIEIYSVTGSLFTKLLKYITESMVIIVLDYRCMCMNE